MASRRRMILQVLAYTLYGLVVLLVLLYVTFPYDLLRQRLVERVSQGDVRLAVARLQPRFPPGLALHNVRLLTESSELPGAIVQMRTLRLQPAWLSLISETPQVHFDGALYDGHLRGEIWSSMVNNASAWEVRGHFAEVQIARHPWLQKEGKAFARGQLGGELTLTLRPDGQMQQGTVNLRSEPAVFTANQALRLLLQRDITCDTLQSQLKMTANQLQIVSFTCKGNDLTFQARGTINWQQPIRNSALNLHLQIRSETVYKQELDLIGRLVRRRPDRRGVLSFSIRGTMRRPRFGA